ncbi:MAG TPA: FkbM family methyltransferase [Solirubrobacteraceae bacterium]|jgi:FkbM family methyltransferase|nr:FkbM family methyltransferase [Solirubrobacteraceae bacterium]
MSATIVRSAIDRCTPLRRAVKSEPGQHVVQTLRGARVVRRPLRFAALQATSAPVAPHVLRDSGLQIFLRHHTRDVHILNEIFGRTGGRNSYEPPPPVAAALDARAPLGVLDLGGNIGLFGAYVLSRWPGSEVRSYEPDPRNLQVIDSVIAANALRSRWTVTEAAVSDRDGEMTFASGLFADSHLEYGPVDGVGAAAGRAEDSIKVRTVDLFALDDDVDLLKMDIEGGEWPILADPRLTRLRAQALVLEWHAQGCPEADPRAAVKALLRRAGYERIEEIEVGAENGLLWAWRNTLSP